MMRQTMNTSRRKQGEKERSAALRLELDYELAVLFEAMTENNNEKVASCKQKLEKIREELIRLKAL